MISYSYVSCMGISVKYLTFEKTVHAWLTGFWEIVCACPFFWICLSYGYLSCQIDFISSLLYGSFAKEAYNFQEPTNRSHPTCVWFLIHMSVLLVSLFTDWLLRNCTRITEWLFFFEGYCSTVQGLLDWFEVDLGFTSFCLFIFTYNRVTFGK